MKFEEFKPVKDYNYSSGWDKFALDYSVLPQQSSIYRLTKELIYTIIAENINLKNNDHILDIGCGTGNDFSYFLSHNAKITAFDKSTGMLNIASESYQTALGYGKLRLFRGNLEEIEPDSLDNEKFDLIFSVTGGFSYIDNTMLLRVFNILRSWLKPGGLIISGHFNTFCLPECIYRLLRLQLKSINPRKADTIQINIKDEKMTMFLRSARQLSNLFSNNFKVIRFYPLLAATPPYQTGYNPGLRMTGLHKKIEHNILQFPSFTRIADQIVMVVKDV